MRTAIVHEWLTNKAGSEQVVEQLLLLYPEADLFCTVDFLPAGERAFLKGKEPKTTFLQRLPFARRLYRQYVPLAPLAIEQHDLSGYDLILSSSHAVAKGVITGPNQLHICYCHTPMRYLWDLYHSYRNEWISSRFKKIAFTLAAHRLRTWDYASSVRVDDFVANSENVQQRIWKTYRRDSTVIHPPVDVESFYWKPAEDYFLVVSELVAHKRVETAIRSCRISGRKLRVVGDGPEFRVLRRMSSDNIEFCGRVSFEDLREIYARCRALILPGEEDFGIVAVEAMASGKPVIAFGQGGVTETVPLLRPVGGLLYHEPTEGSLSGALQSFDRVESLVAPDMLQAHAQRFGRPIFIQKIRNLIEHKTRPRTEATDLYKFFSAH